MTGMYTVWYYFLYSFGRVNMGSPVIEKFPRQVPISGVIPLSLAYGSGLRGLILKEPQCGNIGKQIESTLNCENPSSSKKTRGQPCLTFSTMVLELRI